jgi:hypothetical protein
MAESPETLDALQQFQAAYRNRLGMTAAAPTPRPETTSSFLDLLRERTAENMRRERVQRLSDFGAGIAASGSPNLFAALAAGSRAQAEGERTRMDDLRRVAEAERQQRAQQAEEEYRREQNRIQAERFEAERPLREAQALQARSMAGFYAAGGSGAGRGQITPARLADLTLRAEAQALRDIPEPAANTTQALRDTPAEKTAREQRRRDRARELLALSLSTPEERAASGTVNTTPAPNQQQGRPVIQETFVPPNERR